MVCAPDGRYGRRSRAGGHAGRRRTVGRGVGHGIGAAVKVVAVGRRAHALAAPVQAAVVAAGSERPARGRSRRRRRVAPRRSCTERPATGPCAPRCRARRPSGGPLPPATRGRRRRRSRPPRRCCRRSAGSAAAAPCPFVSLAAAGFADQRQRAAPAQSPATAVDRKDMADGGVCRWH